VKRLLQITFAMLAGLVAAVPTLAQTSGRVWRLGVLTTSGSGPVFETFRSVTFPELAKQGFVEGSNLVVETRVGAPEKLPGLARELVATRPDAVIAVSGWAIRAIQQASSTIPIAGRLSERTRSRRRVRGEPCPARRQSYWDRDARTGARCQAAEYPT
jgi:ABC-type uncharacterized transport system substrate-binding protein